MRLTVSLVVLALLAPACGASHRPTRPDPSDAITNASCRDEPLARAPLPGETGVYRAGPLILSVGEDLAQIPRRQLARPQGSEAIALVSGNQPVTVRIAPGSRALLALQFTPKSGTTDRVAAVRFPACRTAAHRFGGGILFTGSGCARLTVGTATAPASTMLIPIGNSERGCAATKSAASLPSSALPFLGIACRVANSIRCDRIGVGVTLTHPATLVVVRIAGRLVTLSPPSSGSRLWLGYLYGQGPDHGALRVRSPTGGDYWLGSPEIHAIASVTVYCADGNTATAASTVLLHPGFG